MGNDVVMLRDVEGAGIHAFVPYSTEELNGSSSPAELAAAVTTHTLVRVKAYATIEIDIALAPNAGLGDKLTMFYGDTEYFIIPATWNISVFGGIARVTVMKGLESA